MKLTDLNPEWIHSDIFSFDCPCCRKIKLTCKRIEMRVTDQMQVMEDKYGDTLLGQIVPCKWDQAWKINGNDFSTMTVTPSIDASASGHWHGFITNGEIT